MAETSKPKTHSDYTVGWVCSLPKEQTAAMAMLDDKHPNLSKPLKSKDDNSYTLGSIGKHNVAIACLPKGKTGSISAASVALNMISTFPNIKFGFMVGIGGGVPQKGKIRLGDVVVSTPVDSFPGVVQWEADGENHRRTGALNSPPALLLTALTAIESDQELNGSKIPEYLDVLKNKYPGWASKNFMSESLEDALFKADYSHVSRAPTGDHCKYCDRTKVVRRKARDMRVHYGLIASGNQVIEDAIFRDKLNKDLGGRVLCVETEAAGLLNNIPCIIIRGISNYADSHKNEAWEGRAAAVAAAFAKELLGYLQVGDIEQEPSLKELLQIRDDISEIKINIKRVRSGLNRENDQRILAWLGRDYRLEHSGYFKERQPETCQWFLESSQLQTWIDTPTQNEGEANHRTLFCPGIPGAGKTIVTSIVVEHLRELFKQDTSTSIAYVYCNYSLTNDQTIENLLATLLKQLAQDQPSVPDVVQALHREYEKGGARPPLGRIFEALLSVTALYSKVFFVVDALDECGCRTNLLSHLFNLQSKTGAKFFATSRFVPEITNFFERNRALEIEIKTREYDVRNYIHAHLPSVLETIRLDLSDLIGEIEDKIAKASSGMFLLAKLHLSSLKGATSLRQVNKILEASQDVSDTSNTTSNTTPYHEVYRKKMEEIQQQPYRSREFAEKALSWIIFAREPLTILRLQHALAVERGTTEFDETNVAPVSLILDVCNGLAVIDEKTNIVRLIHYTAKEYFAKTSKSWLPEAQDILAETCIIYLSYSTFGSGPSFSEYEFTDRLQQYPLYGYCAENWGHHARLSSVEEKVIVGLLRNVPAVQACGQAMTKDYQGEKLEFSVTRGTSTKGIHLAAYFGLTACVTALITKYSVDIEDYICRTPLYLAAINGFSATMEVLLNHGASSVSVRFESVVFFAIINEYERVAKLLLDDSKKRGDRRKPLSFAAEKGVETAVRFLVEEGEDLEEEDEYGITPLMLAARGGHEAAARLLLDSGANILALSKSAYRAPSAHRVISKSRRTALIFAAENGHETVVRLLIEKGADPDQKDELGFTALMLAARDGHEAITRLLVDGGAKIMVFSNTNDTALTFAAKNGHETVVRLLLDHGASADKGKPTPITLGFENGHEAVVNLMLETRKSHPNTLYWAVDKQKEGLVKDLLDTGTDPNGRVDDSRCDTLQTAIANKHLAILKLLLDKGAAINQEDGYGALFHALRFSIYGGDLSVVKLLLEHGATTHPFILDNHKNHSAYPLVLEALTERGT
ncbi:Ankyrin-1 [Dactylellina cionopaga]|nr:Ankyrin-1 [Dactylellina cionopaga]